MISANTGHLRLAGAGRRGPVRNFFWPSDAVPDLVRCPEAIGGFTVVDVPSREEGLHWAAKIAVACRCAQEVQEIGADPELDAMLRHADSRR